MLKSITLRLFGDEDVDCMGGFLSFGYLDMDFLRFRLIKDLDFDVDFLRLFIGDLDRDFEVDFFTLFVGDLDINFALVCIGSFSFAEDADYIPDCGCTNRFTLDCDLPRCGDLFELWSG